MLLKVGINRRGINGNVDTYVFNEKLSFSDLEKMKIKAHEYIQAIPVEYTEIELYQYDTNAISKLEYIEIIRAFITTDRKIVVYNMIYDNYSEKYIRHRIK
jgi:hypothetical protein